MHPIWDLVSLLSIRRVMTRARPRAGLCLTFDDGPHPEHTPALLDLLRRNGVQATFFLQGRYVERHPELVSRMVEEGHLIGNHSYSHPSFPKLTLRQQIEEVERTEVLLTRCDGRKGHPFRPPHGRLTLGMIAWCALRGRRAVLWTHDSFDYRSTAREVLDRFTGVTLESGDILLFHDDGAAAFEALGRLIPLWVAAGHRFGTI